MKKKKIVFAFLFLLLTLCTIAKAAHSVTLNWTYPTTGVVFKGYRALMVTGNPAPVCPRDFAQIFANNPNLTFTDTTGVGGQTYFYAVSGVDATGAEGPCSNVVTATWLANPIAPVLAPPVVH